MARPLAWITGAGGLIGSELTRVAAAEMPGWEILPLTRAELEITAPTAVRRWFTDRPPSLILHGAGIAKTPVCQNDPALARKVNIEATARLAELAADIPFFFFSTDLAFDGQKGGYTETDATNPLTVYAQTKVEAEQIVLQNPRHTVVRFALNAGRSPTGDRAFNENMRRIWLEGKVTKLFVDEFRTPIPVPYTARAVWELAKQKATGLFHVAGSERLSYFDLGSLLAQRWPELKPQIEPTSIKDFKGTPRAPDTSLDNTKLQRLLSFTLPRFSDWARTAAQGEF